MKQLRSIFVFVIMLLVVMLSSCEVDEPRLSSNKELKTFVLNKTSLATLPIIDHTNHIVSFGVGEGHNLASIQYSVTVSDAATVVEPKPTNLSTPSDLIIKAEDGTIQSYKIIATQVLDVLKWKIPGDPGDFYTWWKSMYKCTEVRQGELVGIGGGVLVTLEDCASSKYVDILLKGKTLSNNLVGAYSIKNQADAAIGRIDTYSRIGVDAGTIEITTHDRANNVVSGKYDNIRFQLSNNNTYWASGDFTNVRIK